MRSLNIKIKAVNKAPLKAGFFLFIAYLPNSYASNVISESFNFVFPEQKRVITPLKIHQTPSAIHVENLFQKLLKDDSNQYEQVHRTFGIDLHGWQTDKYSLAANIQFTQDSVIQQSMLGEQQLKIDEKPDLIGGEVSYLYKSSEFDLVCNGTTNQTKNELSVQLGLDKVAWLGIGSRQYKFNKVYHLSLPFDELPDDFQPYIKSFDEYNLNLNWSNSKWEQFISAYWNIENSSININKSLSETNLSIAHELADRWRILATFDSYQANQDANFSLNGGEGGYLNYDSDYQDKQLDISYDGESFDHTFILRSSEFNMTENGLIDARYLHDSAPTGNILTDALNIFLANLAPEILTEAITSNTKLNNKTLAWKLGWRSESGNRWAFMPAYSHIDADGGIYTQTNFINVEYQPLELESADLLTLQLKWQGNYDPWYINYKIGQVIPIDIQTRSLGKSSQTNNSGSSGGNSSGGSSSKSKKSDYELNDWPSGHFQSLTVSYHF